MAQAKGANGQVLIQAEVDFNTVPTSVAMQKIYFTSCSLAMSRGSEQDNTIQPGRNPSAPARGLVDVGGSLVCNNQAFIGSLWKFLLGGYSAPEGVSPYTHVIKVGETLPSFVLEKGFTDIDQYFIYTGCKVGSASLSLTPAGVQSVTFNIVGASETIDTESLDSTPTDNGYVKFDGLALSVIQEGGVDIATVKSLDLTIENNLDTDGYLLGGDGERGSLPAGMVRVTGTLQALFEDVTLYNKAVAGTESSLKASWANGTGAGSVGNEFLEILIPELIFSPASPAIDGGGGVYVSLQFEGYYANSTEASAVQVTIKNTTAAL